MKMGKTCRHPFPHEGLHDRGGHGENVSEAWRPAAQVRTVLQLRQCLVRVATAEPRGAMWMLKASASSICEIVVGTLRARRWTTGSQLPSAVFRSETIELSVRATVACVQAVSALQKVSASPLNRAGVVMSGCVQSCVGFGG